MMIRIKTRSEVEVKEKVDVKDKVEVIDDKVKKKSHAGAIAGLIIFVIVIALIAWYVWYALTSTKNI